MLFSKNKNFKKLKGDITNKLLLLYLIKKTNELGKVQGITKLQKLVYLIESISNQNKIKSFNYEFIRWYYGPYSKNLYDDFDDLMANQIIKEENCIGLDDHGLKIFDLCHKIYEKNSSVITFIDNLLKRYSSFYTQAICNFIYDLEIQLKGNHIKIKDIPLSNSIIKELKDSESKICFQIEKEELKALEYYFDKDLYEISMTALKKAMHEKAIPYVPL